MIQDHSCSCRQVSLKKINVRLLLSMFSVYLPASLDPACVVTLMIEAVVTCDKYLLFINMNPLRNPFNYHQPVAPTKKI